MGDRPPLAEHRGLHARRRVAADVRSQASEERAAQVRDRQGPVGTGSARVRTRRHALRDRASERPQAAHLRTGREVQEVGGHARSGRRGQRRARRVHVPEQREGPRRRGVGRRQQQPAPQGLRPGRGVQALPGHRRSPARPRVPTEGRRRSSTTRRRGHPGARRDDLGGEDGQQGAHVRRARRARRAVQLPERRLDRRRAPDVHRGHRERAHPSVGMAGGGRAHSDAAHTARVAPVPVAAPAPAAAAAPAQEEVLRDGRLPRRDVRRRGDRPSSWWTAQVVREG